MKQVSNIRSMCRLRGITQKRLAEDIGAMQSQISEVANGKKTMSLRLAKKLAKYFGCSLDVFIDVSDGADVESLTIELEKERARVRELERENADLKNCINDIINAAKTALNTQKIGYDKDKNRK